MSKNLEFIITCDITSYGVTTMGGKFKMAAKDYCYSCMIQFWYWI